MGCRTATSLISFGFTIYKFFQLELKGQPPSPERLIGPRGFALFMIGIGLVALLLSTLEHRRSMQAMRAEFGNVPLSTAAVVAGLISLLGIVTFVACGSAQLVSRLGSSLSHRGRRGARPARREEGEYREYLTDEQRRGTGCIGGRMQTNFRDTTLGL